MLADTVAGFDARHVFGSYVMAFDFLPPTFGRPSQMPA